MNPLAAHSCVRCHSQSSEGSKLPRLWGAARLSVLCQLSGCHVFLTLWALETSSEPLLSTKRVKTFSPWWVAHPRTCVSPRISCQPHVQSLGGWGSYAKCLMETSLDWQRQVGSLSQKTTCILHLTEIHKEALLLFGIEILYIKTKY